MEVSINDENLDSKSQPAGTLPLSVTARFARTIDVHSAL
ncbi:hypothetical protein ACVWY3_001973 [Bradyrhizobium sp. USDA 4486]